LGTTGSLKAGGRFNPPNEFGALYTSLDAITAAKEVANICELMLKRDILIGGEESGGIGCGSNYGIT
jgi:RES domain-containing protein